MTGLQKCVFFSSIIVDLKNKYQNINPFSLIQKSTRMVGKGNDVPYYIYMCKAGNSKYM